jgi:purine-binding chemotaxis protein CheW
MGLSDLGWDEADPEALQKVWKQRADHLAQAPAVEEQGKQMDLVIARFGYELFGLEAQYVYTIRPVDQVTPVPRVPDWVLGVVNLRGRIVSLVDLCRFYHLEPRPDQVVEEIALMPDSVPSLVVVEAGGMEVALYAREVLTVESFQANRIREAGDILHRFPKEAVKGILFSQLNSQDDQRALIVVLNIPAILADRRLIVDETSL